MTKISALSDIGTSVASNDTFVLVDVSDPTTPNKKIQQQNLFLIPDGSAGTPGLRFLSDTNVGLFRPTTDTLAIATGGSERLRIDSSGRLGLGTSLPSANIHIRGAGQQAFRITNTTAGFNLSPQVTKIDFEGYNGTTVSLEAQDRSGNTIGGWLNIKTQNSSYALATAIHIDNQQRVGIGTTSPGELLSLAGSTGTTFGISLTPSGWNGLKHRFTVPTSGGSSVISCNYSGSAVDDAGNGTSSISLNPGTLTFGTGTTNTAPAERARIDSSGRFLVGTSSTSSICTAILQGRSDSTTEAALLRLVKGTTSVADGNGIGTIAFSDSGHVTAATISSNRDGGTWTSGSSQPTRLVFSTTADGASSPTERMRIDSTGFISINGDTNTGFSSPLADTLTLTTGGNERIRLDGSGRCLIGTTSSLISIGRNRLNVDSGNGAFVAGSFKNNDAANNTLDAWNAATSGDNQFIAFFTETSSTFRGRIDYDRAAGQVRYSVTSDRRLKSEIEDCGSALNTLNGIKVRSYTWPETGYRVNYGFIAQELNEVLPGAVTRGDDGDEVVDAWAVDYSKLVPLLTRALQEAMERIETLEAEVAALKGV